MNSSLSRRDFLRLAPLLLAVPFAKPIMDQLALPIASGSPPNIIFILLDTLSARHLSLYGYQRETTPNLNRFAQKATVYHAHQSAANFTTPSTATFLTGTYPWTHRAFHFSGQIAKSIEETNIFNLLGNSPYHRLGYAHNLLADILLQQFKPYLDQHIKIGAYNNIDNTIYDNIFSRDPLPAFRSFEEVLLRGESPGSIFYSLANDISLLARYQKNLENHAVQYPKGLPNAGSLNLTFVPEILFDGVADLLNNISQPTIAYIHLFPPHEPYLPNNKYSGKFSDDGWQPPSKSVHFFSQNVDQGRLNKLRLHYDQYIAQIDSELDHLFNEMQSNGLLTNSYVFITSDHGQLFERGIHGHSTELLYEPLIHLPLIISKPNQQTRQDIFTPTSNVDIMPSVLHLTGTPTPEWCQGELLPGLGGSEITNRSIFSMDAKTNPSFSKLTTATFTIRKGSSKLIYYLGYPGHDGKFEFYDLEADPEEVLDLYPAKPSIASELKEELLSKIDSSNRPFPN
ncbi:sulfatase [Chloroflexota bacterium]